MSGHFRKITAGLDHYNHYIEIILEVKNGKYTLHDNGNTLISLDCGFNTEEVEQAINKTMKHVSYKDGKVFLGTEDGSVEGDARFLLGEINKLFTKFENKRNSK